jgi:hypothetical protein
MRSFPGWRPVSGAGAGREFIANFSVTAGQFPFPSDLPAFAGSTDGTLNFTAPLNAAPFLLTGPSLNTLDGFSTTAPLTTSFNQPIRAESISASTVRLIEVYLSNTNKGPAQGADLPPGVPSPVRRILSYGTDYSVEVSGDVDSAGKILKITPLKPLTPSTGATNIGYIVLVTNNLTDPLLRAAQPSEQYAAVKAAASCSSLDNPTLAALCPWYKGHLAIGQAVGVNPESVVLSWSFSTQSINDSFQALAATVPAQADRRAGHWVDHPASQSGTAGQGKHLRRHDADPLLLGTRRQSERPRHPDDVLAGRRPAAGTTGPGEPLRHPLQPDSCDARNADDPAAGHRPERHGRGRRGLPEADGGLASRHRAARPRWQSHPGPGHGRFLRGRVLHRRLDRPAAARHHRHDEPVLSGAERADFQCRPGQQLPIRAWRFRTA